MKKILVIEDNADVRENLVELLELSNYQVFSAENGKAGVKTATAELPDLILCDIMMPELDGHGVLHILSRNNRTADIPFIFLTAKAEKTDFREGMSLGADDYITKPFDDVQLMQTIEARLVKRARLSVTSTKGNSLLNLKIDEAKAMEAIRHLAEGKELRHYKKKDIVYQEGQNPRWLFFLENGLLKTYKSTDYGREYITRVSSSGDFIGYLALLSDAAYQDSIAALEDSKVRLIPIKDFQELVLQNHEVNVLFLRLLARQIAANEEQLVCLAYDSVRRRVASALVGLHDKGLTTIHLLREDLAALAGVAKETAIRTLTDFKKEDLIEVNGSDIHILDIATLKALLN